MAATLTKAMLDDLHKGIAAISILPYPKGGVNLNTLDWKDADQIFTVQDTFQLAPADPDTEVIRVDQRNEIIDFDFEAGDWTFTGNIPSASAEVFDYFFDQAESAVTVTGQEGDSYTGKGYGESKEIEVSVLVESMSKKTAVAIAHVKLYSNPPAIDDHSTPLYEKLTGYVLANTLAGGSKFAVLKAAPATSTP